MSLSRLLFLAVFVGVLLWFFVLPGIEEPEIRSAINDEAETSAEDTEAHEPWTKEEQAVWREQINQRLYGR